MSVQAVLIALMAGVVQLRLEQRQIYVRRAFDRARFAREAVAKRGIQLRAAQRVVVKTQFQRGPNRIGPSAGGHVFLAGREEGRAHGRRILPATAAAVALLQVAEERFILEGEGERRLERKTQPRLRFDAQVIVDLEPAVAENFAGVKQVFRIEQLLDLPHHVEQLVAHLLGHVFRARHADAMFGGERAFELPNEC